MIRRTDDYSAFSNKDLNKIANVVKKAESKKLYDIYENADEAHVVAAELKIKGFHSDVYQVGGKFQVFASTPDSISLEQAEQSGQFKKLAWGRYSFQKESAIGMFDFNFNDGTIWKLSQDENGNQILIKEVEDDNEDEVVRNKQMNNNVKTAGVKKIASYVSDNTFSKVAGIFYGPQNEDWIQLILSTDQKYSIMNKLNDKFDKVVNEKIANCQITDEDEIDEVKGLIMTALATDISSLESLDNFLNHYVQDKVEKAGSQRKYFS